MHFDKITSRIQKLCYGLNTDFVDPVCCRFFHFLAQFFVLIFRIPVHFRPWLRNEWFRAWNRAWQPGNWTILPRKRRLHWRCVIRTMPSWRPALPWPISTRRPRTSLVVGAFVFEFWAGWNSVQAPWKIDYKNWMPYSSYRTHLRLIDWLSAKMFQLLDRMVDWLIVWLKIAIVFSAFKRFGWWHFIIILIFFLSPLISMENNRFFSIIRKLGCCVMDMSVISSVNIRILEDCRPWLLDWPLSHENILFPFDPTQPPVVST